MEQLSMPRIGLARPTTAITIHWSDLEAKRMQIESLPAWAASRIGWLGTVVIGAREIYYLTSGLPQLSPAEKLEIENQVAEIEALVAPGNDDEQAKLVLVTNMILALASGQTSELGAQSRGEAYMFALGSVPAWAVDEAIKKWYTGKVYDVPEGDYKWSPSPAVLLRAANDIIAPYRDTAEKLRRLIDAKPLDEVLR